MASDLHINDYFDGRYKLVELKGKGSFSEVWRAIDDYSDHEVALKVYVSLDENANEDLRREYKLTFSLNHSNLLKANYLGRCCDRTYLIMPYCPESSASYVGCCGEDMLWHFIRDVASGMEYLHAADIVHHDIKPDNILIGADGCFKISDFGISTSMRSTLRRFSQRNMQSQKKQMGSIAYMAPEMFLEDPFSVKASDVWAFGVTLVEMVSGSLPFFGQGGSLQRSDSSLPELEQSGLSYSIKGLIYDCVAKDPWDRPTAKQLAAYAKAVLGQSNSGFVLNDWNTYRSMQELYRAIEDSSYEEGVSKTNPPAKHMRVWWWVAAAAAVITGVLLLIGSNNLDAKESEQETIVEAAPKPVATYLKVNGEEKPSPIVCNHTATKKSIKVATDGEAYSVNSDDFPKWMELDKTTDTAFILHLECNNSDRQRENVVKVASDTLSTEITIIQKAEAPKPKKPTLTPVDLRH